MIAADDERGSRKLISPCNCKPTIEDEERSAKNFKHGAARHRRQKHILRFASVRRADVQCCIVCSLIRRVVRQSQPAVILLSPEATPAPFNFSSDCDVGQSGRPGQNIPFPDCRARSRIALAFANGFDSSRPRHLISVDICQACARTSNRENARPTQSNATGFLFSKFRACSNANAICSTPQSS